MELGMVDLIKLDNVTDFEFVVAETGLASVEADMATTIRATAKLKTFILSTRSGNILGWFFPNG
jgi:hypothetical protein